MVTIEQIKKLNAERTKGEWFYSEDDRAISEIFIFKDGRYRKKVICRFDANDFNEVDALLLVNAPAIAELAIQQAEEIARLRILLNHFTRCVYPVSKEVNQRGYNWSETWLDDALKQALNNTKE